ncbi:MAG: dockerin type I repeat-containing protein [Oscillospiraceae bacterium]|nr:dockerin type I repeat-containing protein [Oscillospiraceae bacterium]
MVIMKKTLIAFALTTSLALMTLPLYALADEETPAEPAETIVTTATTVNLPIETLPKNGQYNGYFKQLQVGKQYVDPLVQVWAGEELDTSDWRLYPCYLIPDNTEEMTYKENTLSNIAEYVDNEGIPLDSPEYAHCFTVDTSEVDTSTPGYYKAHIRTVPGEKAVFHDMTDPEYSYEITMREYDILVRIHVTEKPKPQVFLNLRNKIIQDNEETVVSFGGNATADLTGSKLTAEPEGMVEIGELALPSSGEYQVPQAKIKALKPGIVTITGVTDSGLTTSVTLEILDHTHYMGDVSDYVGNTTGTYLYSEADQPAEFSIADESIAKIVNVEEMGEMNPHYQNITIELLKAGTTTLTAVTPDGRTLTRTITAISSETTIACSEIPSNTTTTTTTVTTANKKGDLNGDGKVDILDVIRLNKSLLGVEQLTDEQTAAADADGNGKVESNDSLLILKYALEMIDSF